MAQVFMLLKIEFLPKKLAQSAHLFSVQLGYNFCKLYLCCQRISFLRKLYFSHATFMENEDHSARRGNRLNKMVYYFVSIVKLWAANTR